VVGYCLQIAEDTATAGTRTYKRPIRRSPLGQRVQVTSQINSRANWERKTAIAECDEGRDAVEPVGGRQRLRMQARADHPFCGGLWPTTVAPVDNDAVLSGSDLELRPHAFPYD